MRQEITNNPPNHAPIACWKHRAETTAKQETPGAKYRNQNQGASPGDVDAPKEASLSMGGIARRARKAMFEKQKKGELPLPLSDSYEATEAGRAWEDREKRQKRWEEFAPRDRIETDGSWMSQFDDEVR